MSKFINDNMHALRYVIFDVNYIYMHEIELCFFLSSDKIQCVIYGCKFCAR